MASFADSPTKAGKLQKKDKQRLPRRMKKALKKSGNEAPMM
jgi:hypothetical protein